LEGSHRVISGMRTARCCDWSQLPSPYPLISQLAIGQTLTDHDVPLFGDFTYCLSTVVSTPLSNGIQTSVTLTLGVRTHLGNDWYFLAGLPVPVTKDRVAEIGMIFWFMKAW
jgi:hypothetical protein